MISCSFEDGGSASLRHVVTDVLVVEENKILIIKRAQHLSNGGKYALIGGYVDRDETIEQCAVREVKEETGYDIVIDRLLRIKDSPERPQEDRQNISFVYVAHPTSKTGLSDAEVSEMRWYDLQNLPPKDSFAFDHYQDIQLYLSTLHMV